MKKILGSHIHLLSPDARDQILKKEKYSACFEYFEHIPDWFVHEGNLTIDSSFDLNFPLVVCGDFVVKGTYTDGLDGNGMGHLICFGNMTCDNAMSRNTLFVRDALSSQGYVYASGNGYPCEVKGVIRARWIYLSERYCVPGACKFEAARYIDTDIGWAGDPEILLNPDLLTYFESSSFDELSSTEALEAKNCGEEVVVLARPSWRQLRDYTQKDVVFNAPIDTSPEVQNLIPWSA